MIHTIRTITVGQDKCVINRPIILYRGDRDLEVEFSLVGNSFMFGTDGNVLASMQAKYAQLVVNTPSGLNMFSDIVACREGNVIFTIRGEMIDEIQEVGTYAFQIRLLDETQTSRVTLPPVYNGIEIRQPIAAEDQENVTGDGLVDYAKLSRWTSENSPTFNEQGGYNKTIWSSGDVISGYRLNKIEDALGVITAKGNTLDEDLSRIAERIHDCENYTDVIESMEDRMELLKAETEMEFITINENLDDAIKSMEDRMELLKAETEMEFITINENLDDTIESMELLESETETELIKINENLDDAIESMEDRMELLESETETELIKINENLGYITYEMFGAVGDGETNDIEAIREAHAYANNKGINVKCQSNKKYKVVITSTYIDINTSVDFNNSTIIVDDSIRDHNTRDIPLFRVYGSKIVHDSLIGKEVSRSTTTIEELADGKEKIIILNDNNKMLFKRKGVLSDSGKPIKECLVVDSEGNLRNSPLFDYNITSYEIFEYRKNKIILENCNFIHIENGNGSISDYYRSGLFIVGSSNVLIRNINLSIEERGTSYPQLGFITVFKSADIFIENCNIQPYRAYQNSENGAFMGTYGLRTDISNNVVFRNVVCNEFHNTSKWGVHTSNWMNYLIFENCVMNRIDAHEGMYNVTIDHSKIGIYGVNAIGGGQLVLSKCDIYTPKFMINLREDYGADWEGIIILDTCTWYPRTKDRDMISIVKCANDHTYDFGKTCYFPNIVIENLRIDDSTMGVSMVYVVGNFDSGNGDPFDVSSISPYRSPEKISIDGVNGYPIVLFRDFPVKKFYAENPLYVNVRNVEFVNIYHNLRFWGSKFNDATLGSITQASYTTKNDDRKLKNRCICHFNFDKCTNVDINLNASADTIRLSQSHITRLYTKNGNCFSKVNMIDCAYQLIVWVNNTDYQQIGDIDNVYLTNCRVYRPIMLNGIETPDVNRINNLYRGMFYTEPSRGRAMTKISLYNTFVEFGSDLVDSKSLVEFDQCCGWSGNVINSTAWKPYTRFKGTVGERPISDDTSYPLGILPKVQDGFIYYNEDIETLSMYCNGFWQTINNTTNE